jgi:cell division protein ZapA (FtsZ GTPase activity inhibitor)|tara:strand:- start:635 stop:772 length:138 start_codon:yes stop_codon:yes gene_type:complete
VETVLEAIKEASEEFRSIRVAFLISVNRTAEVSTAKEAVDLLVKF